MSAKILAANSGLSSVQAKRLLLTYGPNEIKTKNEYTIFRIILSQFSSFLILILIISGSVSIFLKETLDGIAIFLIVAVNAFIGFLQEYKAENAIKALKKMVIPEATVIRDNEEKIIPATELVPGDIVLISEGDKIPADLQILEAFSLKMDESILTGESVPSSKNKKDKLFKGTLVTTGRAKAIVEKTGMQTEFGKIVHMVGKQEKTRSPLTIQLDNLGKKLGIIILFIVSILLLLGSLRGISLFEMLMTAVALGVSAIPEGMPIIVTLTLAIGIQILAAEKAIVRKMNAIETLGATTVICSDKTGTLTMNEMTAKKIFTNFQEKLIPGIGYELMEKFTTNNSEEKKLLEIALNCNNSFVGKNIIGDPTEIALKIMAYKTKGIKEYKKLDENTFSSERKMMSSLHQIGKEKEIFAKGAFEKIIQQCDHILNNGKVRKLTVKDRELLEKKAKNMASQALRVLAFAYKKYDNRFDEEKLIFVGLVGMIDPPRSSVTESLKDARAAGIKVYIITGDNPITAKAIGESIGFTAKKIMTGDEIDKLSDLELLKALKSTEIFARTNPEHKYRIVDLLKRNKEVVAVTGDGVNDAPALKHADVGIAMGIKGTEATKEVADIVLKDDNFTTIITAIREGRRIYKNILAFIKYMLSANFSALFIVGLLTIIGLPLPILPLQILWINLATDALPALALGKSPAPKNIMAEKPHPKDENILKKFLIFMSSGLAIQIAIYLILYFYGLSLDSKNAIDSHDLNSFSHARTLVFTGIVVFELFFAFVCKEEKSMTLKSLLNNKSLIGAVAISFLLQMLIIYTPAAQKVFTTVGLESHEWALVMFLCLSAFLTPHLSKLIHRYAV